jgi:uncharacterized protein (TIGR02118 family)
MRKLVYALRRQPHLTRAEFQRYWREVHAPLVFDRAGLLGIARYVQCHTSDGPTADAMHDRFRVRNGGSPEPFDGFAELWFRDVEQNEATRHASAELLADEANFIDLGASPATFTIEHVVVADERRLLIPTADHDGTLAWHIGLFDWPIVRQWPGGSLLAIDEATRLEILEGSEDFPTRPSLDGTALVVQVASVTMLHERARAAGATVSQPPMDQPWGHRNVVLRDPNGFTVVAFELL